MPRKDRVLRERALSFSQGDSGGRLRMKAEIVNQFLNKSYNILLILHVYSISAGIVIW